jgi:hypothetical protein
MFQKKANVSASARATYAVPGDFCRIFTEDQTALYLLALVLTADSEKAEQCFVTGLEDSIHGNPVFNDWARSWSKRMIIKSAIRLISPAPGQKPEPKEPKEDTLRAPDQRLLTADSSGLLTAVLELAPFERFVFVMTTLEGYSIQECSILLSCTSQEVEDARTQALRLLALAAGSRPERIAGRYGVRSAFFLEPIRAS